MIGSIFRMVVAMIAMSTLAACGGDAPACSGGAVGDVSQPIAIEPFFLDETPSGDVARVSVPDGGTAPLVAPPQGGFVIYAGARLRNLAPCDVTLTAQLLAPDGSVAITNRDRRQTDLEPDPTAPGWLVPAHLASLATVANIPACPDALGGGVVDRTALLDLEVRDRTGRSARLRRPVVAACRAGASEGFCRCTCGPGWFPGRCALDGGVLDAATGGGG